MSGWIKLHRSLCSSAVGAHPEYLAVWIHLLLMASHKPTERLVGRQVVKLEPGQLVFGRHAFSQKTGVSEAVVRGALKALESLQQIAIKPTTKYSVISILKWDLYQDGSPANNQQKASSAPTDDHKQEGKEFKEESSCDQQAGSQGQIKGSGLTCTAFKDAYNRICVPTLSACRAISKKRQTQIQSLANIEIDGIKPFRVHGIPFVEAFFTDCLKNPHWTGNNDRGWKANFDFLIRLDNAIRVLEENL